ncbi:DEAD/DEAH box helicase [Phaeovulum sp.]|uniref:DEAD/DEAH box helicase n=1 Tax=Phaeovulum sp. TaxID=2934796 RepID=UPI0035650D08
MENFDSLGLSSLVTSNLAGLGLHKPTPIQAEGIPALVAGRDLLGLAQTGTGKTAAFGLPIITRLIEQNRRPNPKTVRALILAPTRELATQIAENLTAYAQGSPIRVFRVVGGASIFVQSERLARGVDVLIATPGRLLDLLDRRALSLAETRYLVLDEADQMLDIGFIHALRRIAGLLPEQRQTMLFSATMPKLMEELADSYLRDPVRVQVAPPGQPVEKIDQGVHFVNQGEKAALLAEYLSKHPGELALVFGRTKHGSEKLSKLLTNWGFSVGSIHGNKSQGQRERALASFRSGEVQVLVATDVAARGLDIPEVRHVYNYELPNVPENYVHRIGRTARAGRSGRAVAFCAPGELAELRGIEKTMKKAIPVIGGDAPVGMPEPSAGRAGGGRKGGGGGGKSYGRGGAPKGGKPAFKGPKPAAKHGKAASEGGNARPARRPSRRPKSEQAA